MPYLVLRGWARPWARDFLIRWVPLLLASLLVVWMIGHNGRVTDPNETSGDPAIYHHTLASLIAAFGRLPLEFLSLNGETFDARHIVAGTLVRLLFFIG